MNKYQDFFHRKQLNSPSNYNQDKRNAGNLNLNDWKSFDYGIMNLALANSERSFNFMTPILRDSSERILKKTSISDFSAKQNEIIKSFMSPVMNDNSKTVRLPEINQKFRMLTDLDFNHLIENINEITSPKDIYKSHIILDQDPLDLQIPEGKTRYLQVFTKGKKCPLSLKIKRRKGRIFICSSNSNHEPESASSPKSFTSDYIEIRESSVHFQNDFIYFSIKAIQSSDFTLTLSFGKQINSLAELRRMKRSLVELPLDEDPEESEGFLQKTEKDTIRKTKNFVKANKHPKIVDLSSKASLLNERAENWKLKREKIVSKKKEILSDKKKKTLEFLNRRDIKRKLEKQNAKEMIEKNNKRRYEKMWMVLIYFSKSSQYIRSYITEKKIVKKRTEELLDSVVTIQRIYRRFKGQLPSRDISVLKARNLLLFYHENLKTLNIKFKSGRSIVSSISFISHTQQVFHHFTTFYKSVCRIQRFIRKHFAIKERKLEALVKLWTMVSENMIFRSNEKDNLKARIESVSKSQRDEKLFSFYESYKKTIRKTSKDFSSSVKTFTENRIFQTALSGFYQKSEFTDFLPSTRQMEKMIRSVIETPNN